MSRSTSRRRAAGIGVGALAAVVLAAPSATAAPATLVIDPPADDLVAVVSALPASVVDDEDASGEVALPDDGALMVDLAPGLAVPAGAEAVLFDVDEYEQVLVDEDAPLPEPLPVDVVVTATGPEDEVVLDLVVDVEAAAEAGVAEAYLVVAGVEYSAFAQETPVVTPVTLDPAGADSPAEVITAVSVVAPLEETVVTNPGGEITVELPVESAVRATGVTDLEGLSVFLVEGGDGPVDEVGELSAAAQAARGELRATAVEPEVDLPAVEVDGRTAVLTLSDEQPEGQYSLVLLAPLPEDELGALVVVAGASVEAAVEPEPTPEPTPTATAAPVPTPTATTPPRRNPGLRSNTGVETAAVPGLSDGQLAGLGGGLLALGAVAGVAVLRTQRRSRA